MTEELRMNLQMFAEDQDDEPVEDTQDDYDDSGGDYEDPDDDYSDDEPDRITMTQSEFDQKINQLTAKERTKLEKRLAKLFGTKDLESAAEYYKAGYAVSQAAQRPPGEVIQRVQQQGRYAPSYQPGQQGQPASDHLQREIDEIKGLLSSEREEKVMMRQEQDARKEFGKLFDKHKDDVLETAEEKGLSLTEAAAIVLRPHMGEVMEERQRAKRSMQKKRRVEGSGEAPAKADRDAHNKLSPEHKKIAKRMGVSMKTYYERGKKKGLFQ